MSIRKPKQYLGESLLHRVLIEACRPAAAFCVGTTALLGVHNCWAGDASASTTLPSSGDEIKPGDFVKLEVDGNFFVYEDDAKTADDQADADNAGTVKTHCAPSGSRFKIDSIDAPSAKTTAEQGSAKTETVSAGSKTTTKMTLAAPAAVAAVPAGAAAPMPKSDATVTTTSGSRLHVHFPSRTSSIYGLPHYLIQSIFPALPKRKNGACGYSSAFAALTNESKKTPESDDYVQYDAEYVVLDSDIKNHGSQRSGFSWGGMIIPYKFEFHDSSFQGQPSTVGFVGYEGWFPGISLSGVIIAGPGIASSSTKPAASTSAGTSTPSTSSSSGSAFTFTAGVGAVLSFGGAIKAGLIFGRDWQGSGSNFKYENKTWMALSIGTAF